MALASFARNLLVGASLTGVAVASGSFAAAQQNNAVSGGLAGYVTDSTGAAVPGAKIKLVGPQQTIERTSDANRPLRGEGVNTWSVHPDSGRPRLSNLCFARK